MVGLLLVHNDLLKLIFCIFGQIVASGVAKVDNAGVNGVVVDDFGKFGEVPGEPLLQAHGERVNVLVHLLDHGNCLRDGLVLAVHILSAL